MDLGFGYYWWYIYIIIHKTTSWKNINYNIVKKYLTTNILKPSLMAKRLAKKESIIILTALKQLFAFSGECVCDFLVVCLFVCLHNVALHFHMLSILQIDFVSLYRSIIPWIQMGVVHQGDRGCIYSFGIQLDKKGFLSTINKILLYIICVLRCVTKWCQFLSVCSLIGYKIMS